MTDHAPDRFWSGIDIPKTIAGVLAAVSAAVLGSFLGVAGTLAGAAVASVVGSVGTELYHRFIDRGSRKIKSTFVTAPAAVGTPPVAAAGAEAPSEEMPAARKAPVKVRWGRVTAVAAAVFVLAMGALTAFELITRQSVADAVGNRSSSSTTLGSVLSGGGDSREEKKPATSPSDSAPATDESPAGPEPTTEPTTEPTQTTEPTDPATGEPTDPATTEGPAGDNQQPDGGTQPGADNAPAGETE